jgi:4-amino-4-deoxy-L-arabinose transferase-like glycosyltransferase
MVNGARGTERSQGLLAACVLAVFAAVWLAECALTSFAPPVDNLEQLAWQHSLEWGYYKHPPLPTALAWLAVRVIGPNAWATYLLGAALTVAAMALFWRLLRDLRGAKYATLALLAALCITFYNSRLYYYNHNVVLLVLVTAAAWACWRAFQRRTWGAWALVGVVLGLGALTKYQIAVTALSAFLFWASQRGWRDPVHRGGALLAVLVALVLFTPHLLWLPRHDFGPVAYAMGSSLGASLTLSQGAHAALMWTADELLNRALPALLFLVIAWLACRETLDVPARAPQAGRDPARALLFCWGVVPLAFMALVGMLSGASLQMQWGTPFLLFIVPCVMELVPAAGWDAVADRGALKVFAALQVLLVAGNAVMSPEGVHTLQSHRHWRDFRSEAFARSIGPAASSALGAPVRVVIGPQGEGGALALHLPGDPLLLLDGRYDRSPWVTEALVEACGAVEVARSATPLVGWMAVGGAFPSAYWRVIRPHRAEACPVGE